MKLLSQESRRHVAALQANTEDFSMSASGSWGGTLSLLDEVIGTYATSLTSLFQSSLVGADHSPRCLLRSKCDAHTVLCQEVRSCCNSSVASPRLNSTCRHRRPACIAICRSICARSNLASSPPLFRVPFPSRPELRWS